MARMFAGFRKLSLDEVRKAKVVKDVQQYILARLDSEPALRAHMGREDTAELLNQLHIKSHTAVCCTQSASSTPSPPTRSCCARSAHPERPVPVAVPGHLYPQAVQPHPAADQCHPGGALAAHPVRAARLRQSPPGKHQNDWKSINFLLFHC
jgi:hypothetical protein